MPPIIMPDPEEFDPTNVPVEDADGTWSVRDHNEEPRKLGAILSDEPPGAEMLFAAAPGAQGLAEVPEDQWSDTDLSHLGGPVKDQGRTSGCNGYTCAEVMEIAWRAAGRTPVAFSGIGVYALINGGQDGGSLPIDGLKAMRELGTPTEAMIPPTKYDWIYKSHVPASVWADAARYKIDTYFLVLGFKQGVSSVMLGRAFNFGCRLGQRFKPDANGVIPDYVPNPPRVADGHAMTGVGFARLPQYGNRPYIFAKNHWTKNWGLGGYCWMPASYFDQKAFQGFVAVAPRLDPNDPNNPPSL